MHFRALLIGDVVGKPGRRSLREALPALLADHSVDVVIVNGENTAGGSGITPPIFEELRGLGVDVVTMGDHVYRKKEIVPVLAESDRLLRPANLPDEAVGRGFTVLESQSGFPFAVTVLLGRTFMKPAGCPFHAADAVLAEVGERAKLVFVEMHAEATSDRIAMGWHLDGRVTCVYGTHTHVQTADERVLPGGTAYISDLGMTGPHDGVLGRRTDKVLPALITGMPRHFDVSGGDLRVHGALVTADTETGRATAIERIAVSVEIAHEPAPEKGAPKEDNEGQDGEDAAE
ncbi:MAG: TIGR00282 family metallophosphoesterase [Planctomycetes bacterium]|nr:TIGR00282 family metallophosphoesterase [Planctomycetota bacterium]